MNVLVIDAQGGGIGKLLVSAIKASAPAVCVTAVGTNSNAAAAMRKAGADFTATGENAVLVCTKKADIIAGPVGIVIADSMLGEITPAMALAIDQSLASRVLVPISHCDNFIAGVESRTIGELVQSAAAEIKRLSEAETR